MRAAVPENIDGAGLRVAIVRARWNDEIVGRLADGVHRGLTALGVTDVAEHSVPGCFEIPFGAKVIAESGTVDAIVCIGAVIRGETTHYEIVSEGCASGVQDAQLTTGVPVALGILTVENDEQAMARSQGPGEHNVGEEAALVAVEMARLAERMRS